MTAHAENWVISTYNNLCLVKPSSLIRYDATVYYDRLYSSRAREFHVKESKAPEVLSSFVSYSLRFLALYRFWFS